jgi:phenylalanyl-tRNA synthetase beta chain
MKISYNWLKRYLTVDKPAEEIARLLTNCGLEVESYEGISPVKGGLKGVVIGEVKTCVRHPDSDHLSLTTVDIGLPGLLHIVCGAPNVSAGQKVPVATIGTVLYQGDQPFEIKRSKIRGEWSEGMICAEDELGLGTSHAGIMVLPPETAVGGAAAEYFRIESDVVFEIGLTPNRTDAMSHSGVARDLLAALKVSDVHYSDSNLMLPSVETFYPDNQDLIIDVEIEDADACPRYSGGSMTGVKVAESPPWLKNLLMAAGIRPINNLVDISNFVMLETGQPLHFFDADQITGRKVIIKKLPPGSLFITLDEVKRELTGNDLMICNTREGMCMAGVFGGLGSGVSDTTTSLFIESAHFDPKTIRKTSRYHGLQTDSSFRFERGADPNGTIYALKRAALLVKEITGGKISSAIVDVYPKPVRNRELQVRYRKIDALIGKRIDRDLIYVILQSLGIGILQQNEESILLSIPTYKVDVTGEADVIEEILRIYGYNNVEIPSEIRSSIVYWERPDRGSIRNLVTGYLNGIGFNEIMNNSLSDPDYYTKLTEIQSDTFVTLLNPLSRELKLMRPALLFGGLETIIHNINRKSPDLKFFEFGNTYIQNPDKKTETELTRRFTETGHLALFATGNIIPENWYDKSKNVDIHYLKGIVTSILRRLGTGPDRFTFTPVDHTLLNFASHFRSNEGVIAEMGMVRKELLTFFGIRQDVLFADFNWDLLINLVRSSRVDFRELPRFPEVRRDLALLLANDIRYEEIEKVAFQVEKNLLKQVRLFDVYEGGNIGEGKKSYAVTFILQHEEKTLTDPEIDHVMKKLIRAFEEKLNAVIR